MKPHSTYFPVESKSPLLGLVTAFDPTLIKSSLSPNLLNVTIRDGIVRRRPGYFQLGGQMDGVILGITEFSPIGVAENLVIFTSIACYWFDATNNVFVDISIEKTASYAITAVTTGTPSFTVAEDLSAQQIAGTKFVVVGSTNNDGTYTVVSVSGTGPSIITTAETMPDDTVDGTIHLTLRYPITGVSQGSKTFTVAGNHSANFTVGKKLFVKDSTGNDATYTVVSSTGTPTVITVSETISDSTADGYLTLRVDRSFTEGDVLSYQAVTDLNSRRILATNGVNNPIQWFGVTNDLDGHFFRWAPNLANFISCDTLKVFKEHLFMGGLDTAGDDPSTIAWSDSGDFEDFTNGNAGSQILYELATGIKRLETLGDRITIYSRDAIATGIFVGSPFIFAFETIIPEGIRLASHNAVISVHIGHYYASQENVYLFNGTRGLRTLADAIRNEYTTVKDFDNLHKIALLNDYSKRTMYMALPTTDGVGVVYTLEYDTYNLNKKIWGKEIYADTPRSFGFFTNTFTYLWTDTTQEQALAVLLGLSFLPWSHELGPWANEAEQKDFPVRVFGDEDGFVFASTEGTLSDNGTIQTGHYDTMDFTVPAEFLSTFGRWGEIEFEASGGIVKVYALTNFAGETHIIDESLTLDGALLTYRLPIDIIAKTLRVRFVFDGAFELHWVRCWVKSVAGR
ncbi:MAG: hypothetical protein QQN63_02545 [Nitrosopumilus sp.]